MTLKETPDGSPSPVPVPRAGPVRVTTLDYGTARPRAAAPGAAQALRWIGAGAVACPTLVLAVRVFIGPSWALGVPALLGLLLYGLTLVAVATAWVARAPVRPAVRLLMWATAAWVALAMSANFLPFGRPAL